MCFVKRSQIEIYSNMKSFEKRSGQSNDVCESFWSIGHESDILTAKEVLKRRRRMLFALSTNSTLRNCMTLIRFYWFHLFTFTNRPIVHRLVFRLCRNRSIDRARRDESLIRTTLFIVFERLFVWTKKKKKKNANSGCTKSLTGCSCLSYTLGTCSKRVEAVLERCWELPTRWLTWSAERPHVKRSKRSANKRNKRRMRSGLLLERCRLVTSVFRLFVREPILIESVPPCAPVCLLNTC